MRTAIELNIFEEHHFKAELQYYKIKQFDLARSIGVHESVLSKQLNGITPMKSGEAREDKGFDPARGSQSSGLRH